MTVMIENPLIYCVSWQYYYILFPLILWIHSMVPISETLPYILTVYIIPPPPLLGYVDII